MKKIVLFTGAGFVAPLGLPTTTQFIKEINMLRQDITGFVSEYLGKAGNDIESILTTLEMFSEEADLTGFLIPKITAAHISMDLQARLKSLKGTAYTEIVRIRKIIFEKLQGFDAGNSKNFYLNVYRQIKELTPDIALSIFTTNYDLTFETAYEMGESDWNELGIKEIDYGFPIKRGRPIYDPARVFEWDMDTIEYLKLHGSLDWHLDFNKNCSKAGAAVTPNDPSQIPILYPGFKSIPENEPFSSLHSNLFSRLTSADLILVAGFAFRDSYINNIFENVMRAKPGVPIYCFNPMKTEDAPQDSRLISFASKYSSFHHEKIGVSTGDHPLGEGFPNMALKKLLFLEGVGSKQ
ncbi:MAG TPA: SIR2 family protein [Gammaproteobacteria bacterium]|nr:SIR2 family protein [Gammaproteobacteria bacterium]